MLLGKVSSYLVLLLFLVEVTVVVLSKLTTDSNEPKHDIGNSSGVQVTPAAE